jgi:hypothetical protein
MGNKPESCTSYLGLYVRPSERAAVRAEARRIGMTTAAFIRSRLQDFLEPSAPGRPWPSDPAERRRKTG